MTEQILVSNALADLIASLPVLIRISAMVMTMPVVASRIVPFRVKAALIITLSILVAPSAMASRGLSIEQPVELAMTLVNEALIGALMGISFAVILAVAQLAGTLIEGLCGFSMSAFGGTGAGGNDESGNSPFSKLFWWTTIAVFISAGGINRVVKGLLSSFETLPVGTTSFDQSFLDFLVLSIGQAFEFGLMAALPAIAALLVASVVLGMAQRNFPQLGGMQVGLNIKAIFGMVVTSLTLLSAPWVIHGGVEFTLDQFQQLIQQVSIG